MSAGGASTAAAATRRFEVAADAAGRRLDVYLAQQLDETRSRVQRWIRDGRIAVDGALERRPSRPIAAGETIECRPETPRVEGALEPQSGVLDVLWEDEHLVVIDKQPGVAVHPGAGRGDRTLVNFLLERYPEIAQVGHPRRPGIVHRLDLGTSGALAVARTPQAYRRLTEAFAAREVGKLYLAPAAGAGRP